MSTDALSRVWRRVLLIVGRGRVGTVNDGGNVQKLQAALGADETVDGMPRLAEYGFTSNPPPGSDVVAIFVAGERSNGVVIACGHQVYRMKGLATGEVALYDNQGQSIKLSASGIVIEAAGKPITVHDAPSITTDGDVIAAGNVHAGGGLTVAGTTVGTGGFQGTLTGDVYGNLHGHADSSGGTSGNAASATKLQTPRNINGVAFDGTANITIPVTLPTVADKQVLSNLSGATAIPTGNSLSAILDNVLGSTQGQIITRNGSVWTVLNPGTAGYYLQTSGPGLNAVWAAPAALPSIANNTLLANTSGSSALPVSTTLSALLDSVLGTSQGNIITRNGSSWTVLAPGTSGFVLQSGGAGANVSWVAGNGLFTFASAAPSSPVAGARWVDSTSGIEYTYMNDGTSSQWVEF